MLGSLKNEPHSKYRADFSKMGNWLLLLALLMPHFAVHPLVQNAHALPKLPGQSQLICPSFEFLGKIEPALTELEQNLVCGINKESEARKNPPWTKIPYDQSKYHLTVFLQERGYHDPKFTRSTSPDKPHLVVVGEPTRVTKIHVEGNRPIIDVTRKRGIIDQKLTPALLSNLEQWTKEQLGIQGYSCPYIVTRGDPETGEIFLKFDTGHLTWISAVGEEPVSGIESGLLRRHDAFPIGKPFDDRLLDVTKRRINSSNIVESIHFTESCKDDRLFVDQKAVPGRSRILTLGVGTNTEGLLLGKATWTNTRLGRMGSDISVRAEGSARKQSLETESLWYFLPQVSRLHLVPSIKASRRDEAPFEYISVNTGVGLETLIDYPGMSVKAYLGPSIERIFTFRGIGPTNAQLLPLEGRITLRSHMHEYYQSNPQEGFQLGVGINLLDQNVLSPVTAQKVSIKGESLWNIGDYSPALFVFGVRGGLNFTLLNNAQAVGLLPINYLHYLGGSIDLRGFPRQGLPRQSDRGALTAGFVGIEARLRNSIEPEIAKVKFGIEPFAFVDVGAIGTGGRPFDLPLYWSPGVGVQVLSPIGPLRFTFAHGFENLTPDRFQFYFALGEEF